MQTTRPRPRAPQQRIGLAAISVAATLFCTTERCSPQGTSTITFEGQPPGTQSQVASYTESGMIFSVIAPGGLYLSGGAVAGYPTNGTGYLEIPDAFTGGGGMTLGPTNAFPTSAPFNLLSFDAAVYADLGTQTLEVVGYKPMAGTVTNYFVISGQTFQTLHPDFSFTGLFRVDFLSARWSLDNLVVSGVPEPSALAIAAGALCCAFAQRRITQRKKTHPPKD